MSPFIVQRRFADWFGICKYICQGWASGISGPVRYTEIFFWPKICTEITDFPVRVPVRYFRYCGKFEKIVLRKFEKKVIIKFKKYLSQKNINKDIHIPKMPQSFVGTLYQTDSRLSFRTQTDLGRLLILGWLIIISI